MKIKIIFAIVLIFVICSCKEKETIINSVLYVSNSYLTFPIDENTRLPKACLWSFEDTGINYIAFPNNGNEILIYNINDESLEMRIQYQAEGNNGVGNIYGFAIEDFNHIYIADINSPIIYVTDSTANVRKKIFYEVSESGINLIPTYAHTITYNPISFLGDSIYVAQDINMKLFNEKIQSPLGAMIDTINHKIATTPLFHHPVGNINELPYVTGGKKVSVCFNGTDFVYSYHHIDTIYKLSRDFTTMMKYPYKSRYIKKAKVEVLQGADMNQLLKRQCELPAYGNLIYDKYRNVYYRFGFPEVQLEKNENYLNVYHYGRKQFFISVLDENFNIIGETLFPEYTYNSNMFFISPEGLYLSVSHYKRADFDENVFRFQKIDLKL